MDGGNDLNILYASTLDKMGIPRRSLRPSNASFYGIMPRKEAVPLGRIWLNVTFGQPDNFRKEPLNFEVVDRASPSSWPSLAKPTLGSRCPPQRGSPPSRAM